MNLSEALVQTQRILHEKTEEFFDRYIQEMKTIDEWMVRTGEMLKSYALDEGKAVRPMLVAAGAALSQDISLEEAFAQKKVQLTMLIVEYTHKRILMADDVADQDDIRHHKPTFHKRWEAELARHKDFSRQPKEFQVHIARSFTEISGLVWQNLISFILADEAFSSEERRNLLITMQKNTYDPTPAGWFHQFAQNFQPLSESNEEELYQIFENITGEYSFVSPLTMGMQLGPNAEKYQETVRRMGRKAGIVFQIVDDLIGVLGDTDVSGKPVGNDFREGKKSLLVQYAYRQSDEQQRAWIGKMVGNHEITPKESAQLVQIIRETGADTYTRAKVQQFADETLAELKNLPAGEVRSLGEELLELMIHREK